MFPKFLRFFKRIQSSMKEDWIITARRNYANRVLARKIDSGNSKRLSSSQVFYIENLWKSLHPSAMKLFDLEQYSIYNKYCTDPDTLCFYIPDDFYYCYADTFFTNYHTSIKLDNKNLYDLYFHDINRPTSIVRNIDGKLMDFAYREISIHEAISICNECNNVIIKSAINSDGGHGVNFIYDCINHKDALINILENQKDYVVQKIIKQHHKLGMFNPESINTIRVMTLYFKGNVHVLSSVFRVGVNGAKVDNASSGGLVCGINSDGVLKNCAYDSSANVYYSHPQGKSFDGIEVPSYKEIISISKSLANRFINYSKLISWDFAIDENGTPILIEANLTGGQLDFHQLTNGPIWGEMTIDILEQIFANSKDIKEKL